MQIALDEIISIKKLGQKETIDINVSGDNLFFANNILTHNSGYDNSDMDLSNVSESAGLSSTVDLMLAVIRSEELDALNQLMIKQLKNRYSDPSVYKRFVIGVDRDKMKLYDVEESAQKDITDSGQEEEDRPLFDKSTFGKRQRSEGFNGFKF